MKTIMICITVIILGMICGVTTFRINKELVKVEMAKLGYEQVENKSDKYNPLWIKINK